MAELEEIKIKYVCGIDFGSQSCSGCVIQTNKNVAIKPTTFVNDRGGWQVWEKKLSQLDASPSQILIGIEATSRYWEKLYHELEQRGYVPGERVATYQELARLHILLSDEAEAYQNEIQALLVILFPEFTQVFAEPCLPGALRALHAYPSASEIAAAGVEAIAQVLENPSQGPTRHNRSVAQKLVGLARRTVSRGQAVDPRSVNLRILCDQLIHTQANLASLQAEIEQLLTDEPQVTGSKHIPEFDSETKGTELRDVQHIMHTNEAIAKSGMNIKINEPLMKYRDPISKITVDLGHADLFGTTQLEHKLWVDYIFDRFGATLERRFRRYVVAIVFATIIWGLGFIISLTIGFSNKYLSTSAVYYFWIGIAWCTNALRWLSQVYHIRTNAVRPCFVISDAVYKSIVSPFARKAVRNKRLFLRSTLISIPVLSYFGSIMSGYIKPLSFLALGFPSSFPIYWLSGNFLLAKLTIIAIFLWVAFLEVYTGAQLTLSTAPLYTKLAALPVGQYFFLKDYWHPPLILPIQVDGLVFGGLADLLFAFAMGGIATAAFPVLFRQITLAGNSKPRHWIGFAFMAIEGVCVIGLTQFLNVNSIFSSSAGLILTAALMILVRRDLFKSLVVSGLISGLALASAEGFLSFIVPLYLSRYWYLYHTEYGMLIFNRVPATELLWGIAFGMAIGPILDFYKGQTFAAKTETNFDSAIKLKYSDKPKKERLHT